MTNFPRTHPFIDKAILYGTWLTSLKGVSNIKTLTIDNIQLLQKNPTYRKEKNSLVCGSNGTVPLCAFTYLKNNGIKKEYVLMIMNVWKRKFLYKTVFETAVVAIRHYTREKKSVVSCFNCYRNLFVTGKLFKLQIIC